MTPTNEYQMKVEAEWNNEEAAKAWERWHDQTAVQGAAVNDRLLEHARVGAGMRVLDLASGTGHPGITIARRLGPSGRVTLTDLSGPMLEVARAKVAREGLDNVSFEVADAHRLPFERSRERRHVGSSQSRQGDQLGVTREPIEVRRDLDGGASLSRAKGGDDREPRARKLRRDEREQRERRLIGSVKILDDRQQRTIPRGLRQVALHCIEDEKAIDLGGDHTELRQQPADVLGTRELR